jgi:hypothetical protein
MAKKELTGLTFTQETSQKELEGGWVRNHMTAEITEALQRRYERCEKA